MRAITPRYHFDPGNIAAWGGSAGGYLASMLGTAAGIRDLITTLSVKINQGAKKLQASEKESSVMTIIGIHMRTAAQSARDDIRYSPT